ncbi:MAG: cysteine dioxygenase [Burkholderiales bacterium]|nr:MAG: cysteine dioxygenase [Burkholderiales bacterium]
MTRLVERTDREPQLLAEARGLLARLIADDAWLPDAFAAPDPRGYRQYLLYCDPLERFSVVSFVWGPGHRTPVHDHTVWGLVGVLRGAERCEEYVREGDRVMPRGVAHTMAPGMIEAVSPSPGDWHVVSSAMDDRYSVSIHVYGANIGAVRRHVFEPEHDHLRDFVSGYSLPVVPNLWDRSGAAARAAG